MNTSSDTATPRSGSLRRFRAWIVLGVIYVLFWLWYTPLGGPLSDEEIIRYETVLQDMVEGEAAFARWQAFMRGDSGDDFAMFNAIDFRDTAEPVPGLPPGTSGREATARYSDRFFRLAVLAAAHPVMIGSAAADALDMWGIAGADHWDVGALVRYRSRRDLMNQVTALAELTANGEDIHRFKIAGLTKTIAYPLDPWFQLGDPRLLLALVLVIAGLALEIRRGRRPAQIPEGERTNDD